MAYTIVLVILEDTVNITAGIIRQHNFWLCENSKVS